MIFDLVAASSPLIGELLKVLLSLFVTINVGAYIFLWNEFRKVRDDKIPKIEEDVQKNSSSVMTIKNRFFGISEDETADGYLSESENRFDEVDSKLEEICKKIEDFDEKRRDEYKETQEMLNEIVFRLSEEENIEIDEDDFDF